MIVYQGVFLNELNTGFMLFFANNCKEISERPVQYKALLFSDNLIF